MKTMNIEKHRQLEQLEEKLLKPLSPLHVDSLLDAVECLVSDCDTPCGRKLKNINNFLKRYEEDSKQIRQYRIKIEDFDILKLIGRGAYGEVKVVRQKSTKNIYAMKQLSKYEISKKADNAFFWEEREVMALTHSEWIVQLHHAFQDRSNLYMVMDYMPGGDLVGLMMNYEISEEWAKFYTAEMILALDAIHNMGFIHKDVKPENMLIDRKGHLKLADFGTSKRMDSLGNVKSEMAVGTPEYISPEVLQSQEGNGLCGVECDFWGVGVILYEMLFDNTPFASDSMAGLYGKIMKHNSSLEFPDEIEISCEAKDIIRMFLSSPEERLGRNGINEIKTHTFFENAEFTFENIRQTKPPFIPELNGEDDTCYFEDVRRNDDARCHFPTANTFEGNQLPFIGFTYSREFGVFSRRNINKTNPVTIENCETPCNDVSKLKSCLENERIRSKELEEKYTNAVKQLESACYAEKQTLQHGIVSPKKLPKLDFTFFKNQSTKKPEYQKWHVQEDDLKELKLRLEEKLKSHSNIIQQNFNVTSVLDLIQSSLLAILASSKTSDDVISPNTIAPPDLEMALNFQKKSYAEVLKSPQAEQQTKRPEFITGCIRSRQRGKSEASVQTKSPDSYERGVISGSSVQCTSAHVTDWSYANLKERLQKLEEDLEQEKQNVLALNSQINENTLREESLNCQLDSALADLTDKDLKLISTQKELAQIKSGSEILENEVQELKTAKTSCEEKIEELSDFLEGEMYSIQLYKMQLGEKIGESEKYQLEVGNLTEERDNLKRKLQLVMESAESDALSLLVAMEVINELQKADPSNCRIIDAIWRRESALIQKELDHMMPASKNKMRWH